MQQEFLRCLRVKMVGPALNGCSGRTASLWKGVLPYEGGSLGVRPRTLHEEGKAALDGREEGT